MKTTIEQRAGRITEREFRAIVEVAGRIACGPWEYTKRDAQRAVAGLKKSLLPSAEESERICETETRARCERARVEITHTTGRCGRYV